MTLSDKTLAMLEEAAVKIRTVAPCTVEELIEAATYGMNEGNWTDVEMDEYIVEFLGSDFEVVE